MSESDYRKAVRETQQESSTADNPEAAGPPEGEEQEDGGESELREQSEEAATGRPGQDDQFEQAVEEAARLDAGLEPAGEVTPGSSPVSSTGGGEPATSSSDEAPSET
jgi:hypothetical protein